jgi:hypothetical protein
MPVEIARANIAHFKRLLETETDKTKRCTLEQLLAEEERKLAKLLKAQSGKKEG